MAARASGFGAAVFHQPLSLRFFVVGLAMFFIAISVFASFADLTETERVRGHLTGAGGETRVYSTQTGVVTDVRVAEGDTVAEGDVVATVSEYQFDGQGKRTSDVLKHEIENQMRQIERRRLAIDQRYRIECKQLGIRLRGMRAELELRRQEHALLGRRVDIATREHEASLSLRDSAAISSREYHQAASALYSLQQQEKSAQLTIETQKLALAELEQQIAIHPLQLADERLVLDQARSQLNTRYHELEVRQALSITAPKAGVVSNVVIRPGDLADPRAPVMTLLHPGDELQAWLYLPSRALAMVDVGTEVLLAYDAYPYQTWGRYRATVTMVSESAMDPREYFLPQDLYEPVYLVKASLASQSIADPGQSQERLRAGTLLAADIVTGRRSLLQKLLSPLRGVQHKL